MSVMLFSSKSHTHSERENRLVIPVPCIVFVIYYLSLFLFFKKGCIHECEGQMHLADWGTIHKDV